MRGQEPGSEHDRGEAGGSARPATPPPSFGQTNGRDVPPPFAPSEEADDGETRSVIPVFKGPPPELPEPQPDDGQPWEVPDDDAAPYDWFADTDPTLPDPPRPGRSPAPLSRATRRLPPNAPARPVSSPTDHPPAPPTPALSASAPGELTQPDASPSDRPPSGLVWGERPPSGPAWTERPPSGPAWAERPPSGSAFNERPPTGPAPTESSAAGPVWAGAAGPAWAGAAGPAWAGGGATGPAPADQPHPGDVPTPPEPSHAQTPPEPSHAQTPPEPSHGQTPPETESPWAATTQAESPWAATTQAESPWAGQDQAAGTRAEDEPAHDLPPWPVEPVVPGAPPWDPPPAFTAAAAGMPVWPGPVSDPHAMPPWPAATGELEAEPDTDEPTASAQAATAQTSAGQSSTTEPADAESARTPHAAVSSQDAPQEATQQRNTVPLSAPVVAPEREDTRPATRARDEIRHAMPERDDTRSVMPEHDDTHPAMPERDDTRPIAHDEATRPASHETRASPPPHGPKQPAHYFDPKAAKRDQPPTHPAPLFDPNAPTSPTARPAEPGDVPVWPPLPPAGQKLPDLPFSRESWGQRSSAALALPTPPQGTGPAFPPGAFKQPPFQTPPPPPAPSGGSKRALLVTLGALALAGVATGGFFAYQAVSNPTPTTSAARNSTAPSAPTTAGPEAAPTDVPGASVLNSEQTDPQKLSLSEAFPKKKVSAAGTTFTRVKASMETSCDKAAAGAFAEALKEQKCSRVLRATYVDGKRRYAVTTGIAVLPTKDAATAADQAKNLSKNVWFRPLPGAAGSGGERVHIAGGYAAGLVWGRYIVFSYATHADGHTPSAKEKTLPKVSGAFRDQASLVLERRITD